MADSDVGWLHADAIRQLLDARTPYPVFLGEVTAEDDGLEWPYLVVWPPPVNRAVLTLAGYGGEATTTTQVTASGRDVREVLVALDRTSAALHRRRPAIPGRKCGLITQRDDAPPPPQPDRQEEARLADGRPVFFSFAQFTLFSTATAPAVITH